MSQCANIWAHLEAGKSLTALQAFKMFGVLACHSRIAELRERGFPIDCTLIEINGKRVGKYTMAKRGKSDRGRQ